MFLAQDCCGQRCSRSQVDGERCLGDWERPFRSCPCINVCSGTVSLFSWTPQAGVWCFFVFLFWQRSVTCHTFLEKTTRREPARKRIPVTHFKQDAKIHIFELGCSCGPFCADIYDTGVAVAIAVYKSI